MNEVAAMRERADDALPRPADASERRYHLVIFVLATVVLILSAVLSVRGNHVHLPFTGQPLPGVCSFRTLTGIDCPGCGLTRSFIRLSRGDLRGAWSFNPAGLLLFVVVVFQVPYRAWQLWRIRRSLPAKPWTNGVHLLWIVIVGLFAQWIYRLTFGGF